MGTQRTIWVADDGKEFDSQMEMLQHEHLQTLRDRVDIFLGEKPAISKSRRTEYCRILNEWIEYSYELPPAQPPMIVHEEESNPVEAVTRWTPDERTEPLFSQRPIDPDVLPKADLGDTIGGLTDAEIEAMGRDQ